MTSKGGAVDLNSIKSMKAWLCKNNVKHSDCKDKDSLAERVREAQAKLEGKPYTKPESKAAATEAKAAAAPEEAAPSSGKSDSAAAAPAAAAPKVEAAVEDGKADDADDGADDDGDEENLVVGSSGSGSGGGAGAGSGGATGPQQKMPYDMATLLAALRNQAPAKRPERKQSEIEAPPPALRTVLNGQRNKHHIVCRFCDTKLLLAGVGRIVQDQELFLHSMTAKGDQASRGDLLSEHWVVPGHNKFENLTVSKPQIMAELGSSKDARGAGAGAGASSGGGGAASSGAASSSSSGSSSSGAGADGKAASDAKAAAGDGKSSGADASAGAGAAGSADSGSSASGGSVSLVPPSAATSASSSTSAGGRLREYRYLACGSCDRGPFGITFVDSPKQWFVAHARVKYLMFKQRAQFGGTFSEMQHPFSLDATSHHDCEACGGPAFKLTLSWRACSHGDAHDQELKSKFAKVLKDCEAQILSSGGWLVSRETRETKADRDAAAAPGDSKRSTPEASTAQGHTASQSAESESSAAGNKTGASSHAVDTKQETKQETKQSGAAAASGSRPAEGTDQDACELLVRCISSSPELKSREHWYWVDDLASEMLKGLDPDGWRRKVPAASWSLTDAARFTLYKKIELDMAASTWDGVRATLCLLDKQPVTELPLTSDHWKRIEEAFNDCFRHDDDLTDKHAPSEILRLRQPALFQQLGQLTSKVPPFPY